MAFSMYFRIGVKEKSRMTAIKVNIMTKQRGTEVMSLVSTEKHRLNGINQTDSIRLTKT